MKDISQLSDDDLLKMSQGTSPDISSLSDDELLSMYGNESDEMPAYENGFERAFNRTLDVVPDLPINMAKGVANLANVAPSIARFATSNADSDIGKSIYSGSRKISGGINDFINELNKNKSDYSKSPEQNKNILFDDQGNFDPNMPSISQASDLIGQSLPMGAAIGKIGGGITGLLTKLGLGKGTAALTGYGAGNAAVVAPQAYDQTFTEAYDLAIKEGKSPEQAEAQAKHAADVVMEIMAPFSAATGGIGGKLASGATGSSVARFLKGFGMGAAPEAVEEGGQSLVQDYGIGRDLNWKGAANQGALGALSGAQEGVIALMHGSPNAQTTPLTPESEELITGNAESIGNENAAVAQENAAPVAEQVVSNAEETPIKPTSSLANDIALGNITSDEIKQGKIDGAIVFNDGKWDYAPEIVKQPSPQDAQSVVDAINTGANVDSDTVRGLIRSGKIQWNNGKLEAAPVSPQEQQALQQLAQDTQKTFSQQQQVPLLENLSTGVENVDAARNIRKDALSNIIGQMKQAQANVGKNVDDTNLIPNRQLNFSNAVEDYQLKNKAVQDLKNQLLPSDIPIASVYSDTDTVKAALDGIANRDINALNVEVLHDLIDNNLVEINEDGHPEITEQGGRLYQELSNLGTQAEANTITNDTASIDDQNRMGAVQDENAAQSAGIPALAPAVGTKEYNAQFFDDTANTPDVEPVRLEAGANESTPITNGKQQESALPRILDQEKVNVSSYLNEGQDIEKVIQKARLKIKDITNKTGKPIGDTKEDILYALRVGKMQGNFNNPAKGMPALAHYLSLSKSYKDEKPNVFRGKKYSTTKKNDSPEFKKWFGDSKVVDDKGEPLTVYHGSPNEFEQFSYDRIGSNGTTEGKGFYFTDYQEIADGYGVNGKRYDVHLSIQKPLSFEKLTIKKTELKKFLKAFDPDGQGFLANYGDADYDGYSKVLEDAVNNELKSSDNDVDLMHSIMNGSGLSAPDFYAALKKSLGYDGIIVNEPDWGGKHKIYLAFSPEQIKSAIGNNGNYDPKDPRISYSATPTPEFTEKKEQLKSKVTDIIKKINPSVNIKLMDKMFGEGEALKDSGATSTERQEVAGAYSKLQNLIYASMNTEKWNPEDTAYHEAFHSVFEMLSDADRATLTKAFPGNDKFSSEEQMAVNFARFMLNKNATGFTPAVRRIFLAIKEALRQIGRTLKLGKFNSFEDVFNRVESGEVYNNRDKSLRDTIASADIEAIGKMLAEGRFTPEQLEAAIKEVSPDLHDVVYSKEPISEDDRAAMAEMVAETTGLPEDYAYSVGAQVFSKLPDKEKILRSFAKSVSHVVPEKVAMKIVKDVENTIRNTTEEIKSNPKMNKYWLQARILAQSNDGSYKFAADSYKSKAMHEIRNFFYHDAGTAKSIGETYFEAKDDYINRNMNKIAQSIEGFTPAQLDLVTEMLQNPLQDYPATAKVRNAVMVMRDIIKSQRKYLEDAGLPVVNEIEGYFPRVYDSAKVAADSNGFIKAAVRAYQATYDDLSDADATEMANKWLENILRQDQMGHSHDDDFNVLSDLPPSPDETKARKLTKEADGIMREFLLRNPADVMASSIGKAARAAEFNRRFSKEKWKVLKDQMYKEGVDDEGVRQTMDFIRHNTGMVNNVRGMSRDVFGAMRYWASLAFLPRSAFSSLTEGFAVSTKTGNPIDGLRNMMDGFRASLKTSGSKAMRDVSDMYGITGEIAEEMNLAQRTGGEFTTKKLAYKNKRFFDRIGLTAVTAGQLSATTKSGQFFIGKLSQHIAEGTNKKKSSEFMISELGVPKDKIKEFSEWVTSNGGKKLSTEFGLGNTEMAKIYRTALRRFVNTTIQVPTAATRQRYASTPIGQFVYGLTSYINAYSKNILIRNARILKEGLTGEGYTASDRAVLLSQSLIMLPALMALAAGIGELRDELFSNPDAKEKTVGDRVLTGLSRGGAFGAFDPIVNIVTSAKYQRDPLNTFNGPFASAVSGFIKAAINLSMNNSENTNTAERNAMKQIYSLILAPAMTGAIATYSPFGTLGYGAIQAINSPQFKSAVSDVTAGKKEN